MLVTSACSRTSTLVTKSLQWMTTLMEALEESDVAPVGHPRLGAVGNGGENNGSVDKDLDFVLQVLVIPHPFVQSTNGTVCFSKPGV